MSILDEWVTGFNAAAAAVGAAVTGVIGTFFITRSKYSKLQRDIASDRAEVRKTDLEAGWVERLVRDNNEKDQRLESLRESQLNDARILARQEADISSLRERLTEATAERDRALEAAQESATRMGACEERVRSLAERVLDYQLANGRLFAALSLADKDAAEQLLVAHLRPVPPGKGDEPP